MKFCTRIVLNTILLVPAFSAPASGLLAQNAERSPSARVSGTEDSSPSHLNVSLAPLEAGSEVQGTLRFSMAGDLLSVTGRIVGLDPNKRYRLDLSPSGDPSDSQVIASKPAATEEQLGVVLPDASGNISIASTLNGHQLAAGQNRVMGRTLILSEIGAENSGLKPVLIARGSVKAPAGKSSAQPSKLDDIEPGEVWF